MGLTITLLGTGTPIPDPNRAGPATLIRGAGTTVLVDCGRGAVMRLAGAGVMPPMLDALLITHLHSDHITDLNDVITTHWVLTPGGRLDVSANCAPHAVPLESPDILKFAGSGQVDDAALLVTSPSATATERGACPSGVIRIR